MLLLYGLTQRKAIAREVAKGRIPRFGMLSTLALLGFFTAVTYWRFRNWEPPAPAEEEGDFAFPGPTPIPTTPEQEAQPAYEPSVSWLPIAVVVGLVLAGIVAYVVVGATRAPRPDARARLSPSSSRSSSTRRSTTCVPRPTRAARSSPRTPASSACSPRTAFHADTAETSDEYLPRVLHDLALDARAVERLTALFTRAKFSHHDVDAAMKEEAIDALEQVRDELRLARDQPQPAPDAVPVGASS